MTDLEIAQRARLRPIVEIAAQLGLSADDLFTFGPHMAKVRIEPPEPRGS